MYLEWNMTSTDCLKSKKMLIEEKQTFDEKISIRIKPKVGVP